MSRIILGWQLNRPVGDARIYRLLEEISLRYQPLFLARLESVGLWRENQGLLHVDVPHATDSGLHRTEDLLCCRTGRPTVAEPDSAAEPAPLGAAGLYDRLVASTGAVQADAVGSLNPPFTFCWFDRRSARVGLVHDGLGLDQFFVSHTAGGFAFSNRCWPILRLLGETPSVDADAWRYWFSLGWFPGTSTPLRNVRVLESGEIIVGDSRAVTASRGDALARWIGRGHGQDTAVLMADAADAVSDMIRQNQPATGSLEADLTGGLDSRALCALLTTQRVRCHYYTGGSKLSPDVVLARRIARRFHLAWTHVEDSSSTKPGDLPGLLETRLRRMTLWGEGLVEPSRFQGFPSAPFPTRENVYLGGGSSEISRGHYYHYALKRNPDARFDLDRSVTDLAHGAAELLADDAASNVTDLVRQQVCEGGALDLRDWALLDYFYLRQRTRRWQAAHLAINLFEIDALPFLNAHHITLSFAMRPVDKAGSAFQRFILQRNGAALLRIPLSGDTSRHPYFMLLRLLGRVSWLNRALKTAGWTEYFRGAGRASLERVLSSPSPLWEILDRRKAMQKWLDFARGTTPGLNFPLGLLAFSFWHSTGVESDYPSSASAAAGRL